MSSALAEILNHVPLPLAVMTPAGRVLHASAEMLHLPGARRPGAAAASLTDYLPPEVLEATDIFARARGCQETQRRFGPAQVRYRAPGLHRVYRWSLTPILHPDLAGTVLLVLEDVTDRQKARVLQERVAHSERLVALGEMMAGLAHEINNPLSVISGNAQFLCSAYGGLPHDRLETSHWAEIVACFGAIERESERCCKIVSTLLQVSRRSAPATATRQRLGLNRLLADLLRLYEPQLSGQNIRLLTRFDPHEPEVEGMEHELQQVFMNIVTNARQAMPQGGDLEISTVREGGNAIVAFKDSGVGIRPEVMERIFDPFFTTKPAGQGTGLGLFIANSIVLRNGGTINVESEPGRGARFSVLFPLARAGESSLAAGKP